MPRYLLILVFALSAIVAGDASAKKIQQNQRGNLPKDRCRPGLYLWRYDYTTGKLFPGKEFYCDSDNCVPLVGGYVIRKKELGINYPCCQGMAFEALSGRTDVAGVCK